jgi:hypothetical protein
MPGTTATAIHSRPSSITSSTICIIFKPGNLRCHEHTNLIWNRRLKSSTNFISTANETPIFIIQRFHTDVIHIYIANILSNTLQ